MKINVLYITDMKDGKPNIDLLDTLIKKYNLFLITEEEGLLKFWEIESKKIKLNNQIKFIEELPNFKSLNEYYDKYFTKYNIELIFLRFGGNRIFRFTKNAEYLVPIKYAEKIGIPIYYGRTSESLLNFQIYRNEKNIDFKNDGKGVIYTAVFGGYEEIFNPKFINENIDYICFTDDANFKSDIWEVKIVDELNNLDNTRKARTIKVLPHKYLKDYDFSIWVDAGFEIIDDVEKFLNRYSNSSKLLSVYHTERDCIYEEAEACIAAKLDDEQLIKSQMKKYETEGYPHNNGLIESGILYRKHNDPQVIKVMDDWYHEIINYSKRDQLSFNYVAWKNKLKVDYAPVLYSKNQFFEHYYHLHMKSYQKTIDLFRIFLLDNTTDNNVANCVEKINEINENIPISIITEKNSYNYPDKNIEIIKINTNEKSNDLNKLIKKYKEKFIFIIQSDFYIKYNYFEKIYTEIKEYNKYDAIIFENMNNTNDKNYNNSNFENIKLNREGILFKKQYLNNCNLSNILEKQYIKNTVSNILNKKLVIIS